MAEAYAEQASNRDFQKMDFDERFSLLVDLEHSRRKNNKLHRLINVASFINSNACIEDIEYHADRRLNKEQILKLASGAYILDSHNLILKGPTGSGKTYLATAFGVSACRQSFRVRYIRLPELLDELTLAKLAADRKLSTTHQKIHKSGPTHSGRMAFNRSDD